MSCSACEECEATPLPYNEIDLAICFIYCSALLMIATLLGGGIYYVVALLLYIAARTWRQIGISPRSLWARNIKQRYIWSFIGADENYHTHLNHPTSEECLPLRYIIRERLSGLLHSGYQLTTPDKETAALKLRWRAQNHADPALYLEDKNSNRIWVGMSIHGAISGIADIGYGIRRPGMSRLSFRTSIRDMVRTTIGYGTRLERDLDHYVTRSSNFGLAIHVAIDQFEAKKKENPSAYAKTIVEYLRHVMSRMTAEAKVEESAPVWDPNDLAAILNELCAKHLPRRKKQTSSS